MNEELIKEAITYIEALFAQDFGGHDAAHTLRVYRTAVSLAQKEGADVPITALAALLHDVDDVKLSPGTSQTKANAVSFLRAHGVSAETEEKILEIVNEVSFKGTNSVTPATPEGKCVQDADRLDALGAIGIARTFAYGGSHGRKLYDPAEPPALGMDEAAYRARSSHTVNHFYEKLFYLKDMMNTAAARELAAAREKFMRDFLAEFYAEWNGKA